MELERLSIKNNNLVQKIQSCDAGEDLRAYTNGGYQDYEHTAILKMLPFKFSLMSNTLHIYFPFTQWRPSSVSLSTYNCTHPSTYTFTMEQG